MYYARVIPCLLIRGNDLVKTVRFSDAVYLGDPVNAVRMFSDKEADEIVVLDIEASKVGKEPNFPLIQEMASEAFMPMAYGGGITTIEQIYKLIRSGIEKVIINTSSISSVKLIKDASNVFGSQAVLGAVDVRKSLFGKYKLYTKSGTVAANQSLDLHVQNLVDAGVGEILVNNIDRDGTMTGYDLDLIKRVSVMVKVPVIACGGGGSIEHLKQAVNIGGASAVAAGSLFVFQGRHRAVLINYPKDLAIEYVNGDS